MTDLRDKDYALLRRLIRAGRQGLRIESGVVSSAIFLALHGLARMTCETPQRVIVTPQGEAFARRDAA